jgi:hypothetical protein
MTTPATRPPMTEKQLQSAVVDLAGWLGFLVYHPWLSVKSAGGFPDLTLARIPARGAPRLIFIELKGERGVMRDGQPEWLAALRSSGAEVYVFRPADWHSGLIERVLSGEAERGAVGGMVG